MPWLNDSFFYSSNDFVNLEIIAGGTMFAAGKTPRNAYLTQIQGDQWMVFRNNVTDVLHWDYVSSIV